MDESKYAAVDALREYFRRKDKNDYSMILKTNPNYIYDLIKRGLIPALLDCSKLDKKICTIFLKNMRIMT